MHMYLRLVLKRERSLFVVSGWTAPDQSLDSDGVDINGSLEEAQKNINARCDRQALQGFTFSSGACLWQIVVVTALAFNVDQNRNKIISLLSRYGLHTLSKLFIHPKNNYCLPCNIPVLSGSFQASLKQSKMNQ